MRILLTAFEPFGKHPVNVSERALAVLAERGVTGAELHTALLPVERIDGPRRLLAAFDETQPDAAICLGQAGGRRGLQLERIAVNLLDYRIPDNAGERIQDAPVVQGGPAAYFSRLPLRRMQRAMEEAGAETELSLSAGAYLCNQVFYALSHHVAEQGLTTPVGFVHLPLLPEQAEIEPEAVPTMELATIVAGLRAGLAALGE